MALVVQEFITNHAVATNTTATGFASLAVGDLMISHFTADTSGGAVTMPASWTQVVETTGTSLSSQIAYKVAEAGDVSGNSFQFSRSTASNVTLTITRITGHRNVSVIPASSGTGSTSSTSVTSGTITPALADSLILLFTTSAGTNTTSGYSIVTSSPVFTETYDYSAAAPSSAMAWGLRPQVTATGSASATLSGASVNIGQLIAISPSQDFTVTDTPTVTDFVIYDMSLIVSDTLMSSEEIEIADNEDVVNNLAKNSSSFTNLTKS